MLVVFRALTIAAVAAVVAGAATLGQASPKGTLILTNGESVAGLIIYQGDNGAPSTERAFQVRAADGRALAVALDEVAVVDFAGGRPSAMELDTLGADTPHVLTLRNGNSRSGRLVGVISGEFVRWENPQGLRADVPIRNITRIYLNQERALELYEVDSTGRRPPSGLAAWLERGFLTRPEIVVDASVPWVDTGVAVQRGERVRFSATGGIKLSRMAGDTASPMGRGTSHSGRAPLPDAAPGAIIGRIGADGSPFSVVIGGQGMPMPASGRLSLGINDATLSDNSGSYRVIIEK